jgi:lipopolysaccharide transport system permease protein
MQGKWIKKIYFPREVLVLSACLTAFIMTFIELIVFCCLALLYIIVTGDVIPLGTAILLFPIVFLIEFVLVLGVSLAIASLNVKFRDIQWIWAVVMQAGFFATPIMYSMDVFKNKNIAVLINYNPVGTIMGLLRDTSIYCGLHPVNALTILYTALFAITVLVIGWLIFRLIEPSFAEEV